jgi:hypothetical protein
MIPVCETAYQRLSERGQERITLSELAYPFPFNLRRRVLETGKCLPEEGPQLSPNLSVRRTIVSEVRFKRRIGRRYVTSAAEDDERSLVVVTCVFRASCNPVLISVVCGPAFAVQCATHLLVFHAQRDYLTSRGHDPVWTVHSREKVGRVCVGSVQDGCAGDGAARSVQPLTSLGSLREATCHGDLRHLSDGCNRCMCVEGEVEVLARSRRRGIVKASDKFERP